MAFKFYIDGYLTDQPNNDMALVTTIKRDSDLGGFLTTQDVTLEYSANNNLATGEISGYAYLKAAFDSGTCNEVEVVIFDVISATESYRVYTGVMKVPSMIVDEQRVGLSTKIEDNSFYSFIKNNRNVKFNLYATRSKNNVLITPPQIYEVDLFNSDTAVYGSTVGNLYQGYRIYDVLSYIISAISDDKVAFQSDYLQNMPGAPLSPTDPIELFLFDGNALVNPNTNPAISVSFDDCIRELYKLKNLSFYIDQTDPDNPVLRLEDAAWFFVSSNLIDFDEPLELKTSVKSSKIFGTIKVGSKYNPTGALLSLFTFNAGTSYFGWKEEVYTPVGQCNTDSELDLINDWAISSNAINNQVVGALTTNLDDIFVVECDNIDTGAFTAIAVDYEINGNGNNKYYNVGLNNVNKLNLHAGSYQSQLTNTQDAGTDICHISLGTDYTLMDNNGITNNATIVIPRVKVPIPFADEFGGNNFDGGNNYNNASYYYTAPTSGNYSFSANIVGESANLKSCITANNTVLLALNIQTVYAIDLTVTIQAYTDNTFTTLISQASSTTRITANGTFNYSVAFPVTLPTNAVVRCQTSSLLIILFPTLFGSTPITPLIVSGGVCGYAASEPKITLTALSDSTFICNGTPDGGIILAEPDLALYKVKLHEFQYDISPEDFRSILALPIGSFNLIKDGVTRETWIEELSYNNWTGRANIKLISNDATA